jgi:hypothetical protein
MRVYTEAATPQESARLRDQTRAWILSDGGTPA